MSWLNDPEEARKHPRRVLAAMLLSGLVGGGAIGYSASTEVLYGP
jgi:hypothetical protein